MVDSNVTWYTTYAAGEPIRCPNRSGVARQCGRAQDIVGPGTVVKVRILRGSDTTDAGALRRECRACGVQLEVIARPATRSL